MHDSDLFQLVGKESELNCCFELVWEGFRLKACLYAFVLFSFYLEVCERGKVGLGKKGVGDFLVLLLFIK